MRRRERLGRDVGRVALGQAPPGRVRALKKMKLYHHPTRAHVESARLLLTLDLPAIGRDLALVAVLTGWDFTPARRSNLLYAAVYLMANASLSTNSISALPWAKERSKLLPLEMLMLAQSASSPMQATVLR